MAKEYMYVKLTQGWGGFKEGDVVRFGWSKGQRRIDNNQGVQVPKQRAINDPKPEPKPKHEPKNEPIKEPIKAETAIATPKAETAVMTPDLSTKKEIPAEDKPKPEKQQKGKKSKK